MQVIPSTVWILTYLRPDTGSGVERFVSNLSSALRDHGFRVQILDSQTAGVGDSLILRLRPFVAWKIGRELNRRAQKDDLVICNGYFSWNARRGRGIVIYHGTELGRARATTEVTGKFRNLIVRTLNARLDRKSAMGRTVVAVSESTKVDLEQLYGLKVDAVIPNGIDLREFRPAEDKAEIRKVLGLPTDKFLILYAGPPDVRKGFDMLVHELAPVLKPSQILVMTTRMADPPRNVIPVGRVPFDQIVKYYQACDAFVMPSYYEGCSYALAEAMACGIPSIISNTGSASDMLADSTLAKYVISRNDAEEYAAKLRFLEESIEERQLVSKSSRSFAEAQFDIRDFERSYTDLVKSVLAKSDGAER